MLSCVLLKCPLRRSLRRRNSTLRLYRSQKAKVFFAVSYLFGGSGCACACVRASDAEACGSRAGSAASTCAATHASSAFTASSTLNALNVSMVVGKHSSTFGLTCATCTNKNNKTKI